MLLKAMREPAENWAFTELARGALMVVVNQSFVRHYYPGGNVLGRALRIPAMKSTSAEMPAKTAPPSRNEAGAAARPRPSLSWNAIPAAT